MMRAFFILFLTLLLGVNSVTAYELVLPKEKKSIVNTNYAFFVGKASNSEVISINDDKVYIAPNGAFAHSVKLKDGENRVVLKSNFNTHIYKFYKTPTQENIKPELVEFEPKLYIVKNDNTPLRNTPINYGMNRVSHLFAGTKLIITGKKDDFYRVFLSKNKDAWIKISSVEECFENINCPKFIATNSDNYKNATVQKIEFTEKLPYTIEENSEEIIFKVYNPFYSDDTVYTFNIRKPKKYSYKTALNDGTYCIKVSQLPIVENNALENITITIDAGHGGSERGAIGCLSDKEKDINLAIAQELKDLLCLMGANVVMTRECDGDISLDDRVKVARDNQSNIFVSIHLNSIPDIEMNIHKNKGTSVYYYNPNSKELAKIIKDSVTKTLGTRDDGVRAASFAVLRPTDYIGVLVEVAYMTNPVDSVLYTEQSFPRNAAKGIADGIVEFILKQP